VRSTAYLASAWNCSSPVCESTCASTTPTPEHKCTENRNPATKSDAQAQGACSPRRTAGPGQQELCPPQLQQRSGSGKARMSHKWHATAQQHLCRAATQLLDGRRHLLGGDARLLQGAGDFGGVQHCYQQRVHACTCTILMLNVQKTCAWSVRSVQSDTMPITSQYGRLRHSALFHAGFKWQHSKFQHSLTADAPR
jgi:hypothetical protein